MLSYLGRSNSLSLIETANELSKLSKNKHLSERRRAKAALCVAMMHIEGKATFEQEKIRKLLEKLSKNRHADAEDRNEAQELLASFT